MNCLRGRFVFVSLAVYLLSGALLLADGDRCEVAFTDREQLERAFKEGSAVDLKRLPKVLGNFTTTVGEEEIATQQFIFPPTGERITASVLYTDESLPKVKLRGSDTELSEDSLTLGLLVSRDQVESAFGHDDTVIAEVNYTSETRVVRVAKIINRRGKRYVIDIECHCNGARTAADRTEDR